MILKRIEEPHSQERWMLEWVLELVEAEYILHYGWGKDAVKPFLLTEPFVITEEIEKIIYKGTKREQIKRETKHRNMLNGSTYSPDFWIIWAGKADNVFFTMSQIAFVKGKFPFFAQPMQNKNGNVNVVSYLDIKSPFKGKNCSDATFSLNRKIVWEKYKVFVNKTILMPNKAIKKPGEYLFARTFTASRYRFTDKTLMRKTIKNWVVLDLQEFLSNFRSK